MDVRCRMLGHNVVKEVARKKSSAEFIRKMLKAVHHRADKVCANTTLILLTFFHSAITITHSLDLQNSLYRKNNIKEVHIVSCL